MRPLALHWQSRGVRIFDDQILRGLPELTVAWISTTSKNASQTSEFHEKLSKEICSECNLFPRKER